MHRLAGEPDLARIRDDRPAKSLDQRRFARAVVADHGEDLAGIEIEVGMVERGHPAIALDEAIGLKGWAQRSCRHPPDPLIERNRDNDQNSNGELLPKHVKTGERNRRAEYADDERPDQRADDRAASAK